MYFKEDIGITANGKKTHNIKYSEKKRSSRKLYRLKSFVKICSCLKILKTAIINESLKAEMISTSDLFYQQFIKNIIKKSKFFRFLGKTNKLNQI